MERRTAQFRILPHNTAWGDRWSGMFAGETFELETSYQVTPELAEIEIRRLAGMVGYDLTPSE